MKVDSKEIHRLTRENRELKKKLGYTKIEVECYEHNYESILAELEKLREETRKFKEECRRIDWLFWIGTVLAGIAVWSLVEFVIRVVG